MIPKSSQVITLVTSCLILTCSLVITAALPLAPQRKGSSKKRPGAASSSAGTATIASGKKVYDARGCATCHAIGGKGGASGPELTNTGSVPAHTSAWFSVQVANPKAHNPDSTMPPYAQTIKGKELTDLSAYLTSLKDKSPAPGGGNTAAGGATVDPAIVAKIEKIGGHVGTLAQNDNHLEVSLHLAGAAINDSSLSALNGLKNVVHLDLGQTSITDAGLASLKGMKGLTELHLEGTKITDAGLASLKEMRELTYLNLYGTNITDAGLEHLSHLTNLRHLYVWQTKVTPEGVTKLKKALPQLEVVQGFETAPKK